MRTYYFKRALSRHACLHSSLAYLSILRGLSVEAAAGTLVYGWAVGDLFGRF